MDPVVERLRVNSEIQGDTSRSIPEEGSFSTFDLLQVLLLRSLLCIESQGVPTVRVARQLALNLVSLEIR